MIPLLPLWWRATFLILNSVHCDCTPSNEKLERSQNSFYVCESVAARSDSTVESDLAAM
jgi:hypothetical protein